MRLELRNLKKAFGAAQALSDVSLSASVGAVHAVLGENGAGKSTLMKLLSGAERTDEGELLLDGAPFRPTSPEAARRAGVSIVYQEPLFCADLTVRENIVLGCEPTRGGFVDRRRTQQIAERALRQLGELSSFGLETPVRRLAPADRQLVSIARALSNTDCKVLILDEPTSALTGADTQRLFMIVRRLAESGVTVLYISHFLEEVEQIASEYTVLRDGRSVAAGRVAGTTRAELVSLMAGRTVTELFPRSARARGDVALELRELSGKRLPVRANLLVHRGEVVGIAGLVGSGRTELLRAIFGLDPRASGHVLVGGVSVAPAPAALGRHKVGLLSEDRKSEGLAESLSIAENITLSGTGSLGPYGLALPARSRARAQRWIERLAIRCRGPEQHARALSGGNQQKVALSRLLEQDVDVLLLDEPTRGIDVGSRADIYRLIDELASRGKAVLLVSSYLPELVGVCDRIAVMVRGNLGPARPANELTEQQLLLEATG
ncbi:MAG TPA: sugar ABC transporter ATP-binding protein [Polyangiaceae bacterium]|nr:sugar ABC transporter ATP-binding protein [Polyangiaceae bacterium]